MSFLKLIEFFPDFCLSAMFIKMAFDLYTRHNFREIEGKIVNLNQMADLEFKKDKKSLIAIEYEADLQVYKKELKNVLGIYNFCVGKSVRIMYNPKNPSKCVLKVNIENLIIYGILLYVCINFDKVIDFIEIVLELKDAYFK